MRAEIANERGPDEKAVAIIFDRTPVVVEGKDDLCGVALLDEVLLEEVGKVHALRAQIETIETAVRVLFKLREVGEIELILVVLERAEEPAAEIVVAVEEAARIGDEWLDADARRDEVEVRVYVFELNFTEGLFERELCVGAGRAAPHVYVNDAGFAGAHVVGQTEGRRDFDRPRARAES